MHLTGDERKKLLKIARTAIYENLQGRNFSMDISRLQGNMISQCGVFVTLRLNEQLRGCIGYVESEQPLAATVTGVAIKAATQDPRFIPISQDELKDIVIEISVLSQLTVLNNVESIEIGMHGLYLDGEFHRGLLLPQVAVENNWNRETFIEQLGKKAGILDFHPGYPGIRILKFTADVFNETTVNE